MSTAIATAGFLCLPNGSWSICPANVAEKGAAFPSLKSLLLMMSSSGCSFCRTSAGVVYRETLGLDGKILEVPGVLPIVMEAKKAERFTLVVPKCNAAEGALVEGMEVMR